MTTMPVNATALGPIGQQGAQATDHDAFADMDLQSFIKLMIVELQNQDPLNPMDNAQILQQISQIREIQSNQTLTDTLESVFLGQNVATASGMIGDWVMKLHDTDEGENMVQVVGPVDRVIVEKGVPKLTVDNRLINLKGSPKIQVLSEEAGKKMQEIMELAKSQHRVQWKRNVDIEDSPEFVGRITGLSLVKGDIQFPRYHVVDDSTGRLNLISPDQIIADLDAPDSGADDQTSATP